jgi:endoglucanase
MGQLPFSKGVNLTGWFQASNAGQIQFSRFTKKDFQNIKSLGCDVIRLPINLHAMTSGEPDYILDPLFLEFLDEAVGWAEDLQMHLILDNHTFDVTSNTDPAIGPVLVKVWTQMAKHYKDHSELLYYEVLNEPHGIDDAVWGDIQQTVIDAIRAEDLNHYIVVGPANWNSFHNLKFLPAYSDAKLIYTFHFYDPFVFTHQGASWVEPSMVPLANVPFPYRMADMPSTPESLKGSWIESALSNYGMEGSASKVKQLIDIAVAFKNERSVPVFCGEFGVYIPNSQQPDRVTWYELVSGYLNENAIPWTIWDYTGGFGLFEKNTPEIFEYDLNVPLLEALEFTVPEQLTYLKKPLTKGFMIYGDGFGEGIMNVSSSGSGVLDFYANDLPAEGTRHIYWSGVGQYDPIGFDFKHELDLSRLMENDHTLKFRVRGNSATAKFDVRFIDSKKNETDHPWRMGKTIEGIQADNTWQAIEVPLKDMEEKGAWDNAWFPPDGAHFDWTSVDRFEIVPEHQPLDGIVFSLDEIFVDGVVLEETVTGVENLKPFSLSVYPNPLTPRSNLAYTVASPVNISIDIYNLQGQKVKHVWKGFSPPGNYEIKLTDMQSIPDGLYIIRIDGGEISDYLKVVVRQ